MTSEWQNDIIEGWSTFLHRTFHFVFLVLWIVFFLNSFPKIVFLGPGPENWPGICTTGTFQSPINIESQNTTEIEEKPFIFHGYDVTPKNAEISNNGHTVGITFENQRISV